MKLSASCVAADRILLAFACALAILVLSVGSDSRLSAIIEAVSVIAVAVFIPRLYRRWTFGATPKRPIRLLYLLYVLPSLYVLYPIAIHIGHRLQPEDYDSAIISIDRFLLHGADPTRWIFQHVSLAPLVVEFLQVCYYAHYLYPLVLVTEFIIRHQENRIEQYRMLMVYGSIVSFILNMMVPAIGPRFTLHEFANLSRELPGVWLTDPIRTMINTAEGIQASMTSNMASRFVFRDAFPSGHTMLTLLTLWTAIHYRARVRWLLLPLGIGLIISTVLLRYHYVTDVISGILFALIVIWTAPMVSKFLGRTKANNEDRSSKLLKPLVET